MIDLNENSPVETGIEMVSAVLDLLLESGFPEKAAKLLGRSLNALLREGFAREEALQLLCSIKFR